LDFKLDNRFTKELKGNIEAFEFEVGILKDKAHKWPLSYKLHGFKTFNAGIARKTSPKDSYAKNSDISKTLEKKTIIF
jgi:hypothetical protein